MGLVYTDCLPQKRTIMPYKFITVTNKDTEDYVDLQVFYREESCPGSWETAPYSETIIESYEQTDGSPAPDWVTDEMVEDKLNY